MLSYMLPAVQEKPPPVPSKSHLQLVLGAATATTTATRRTVTTTTTTTTALPLTNGHHPSRKTTTISAESSASSLSSAGDVPGLHTSAIVDKTKTKLIANGATKNTTLKRVSFGSSKGSMVETLIYESPLQEEPEVSPIADTDSNAGSDSGRSASKVRVTFFECEKPLVLSSPEPSEELDAPFVLSMTASSPVPNHAPPYNRQASTDSGWDNPFRPDGDLSREADEIVELIKGGKPITPTPGSVAPKLPSVEENGDIATQQVTSPLNKPPPGGVKGGANGSSKPPGAVELQRATVAPSDASQVEHVVLKKKPKCKCCVIQ